MHCSITTCKKKTVNNSPNDSSEDGSEPDRAAVAESEAADLFPADQLDALDVLKTSNLILTLLSLEGDLVFISPNVINLIGLKQTEMLGMSIFDFVHPCDHDELKGALKQITEENAAANSAQPNDTNVNRSMKALNEMNRGAFDSKNLFREHNKYVSFMVRIKCTLNNKSKCVPLKSANYKVSAKMNRDLCRQKTVLKVLKVLKVSKKPLEKAPISVPRLIKIAPRFPFRWLHFLAT